MPQDQLTRSASSGTTLLRNEPVQARSTARLSALLDAAATVIAEIGYERLTTALVAERAGASIGTVYRYFPDRIVVLQGLGARFLDTTVTKVDATLAEHSNSTASDVLDAVIDDLVELYRTEPGYSSLRLGGVLDLGPQESSSAGTQALADLVASSLTSRFGGDSSDLVFKVTVILDIVDALLSRAFAIDAAGDSRFIAEAHSIAASYLRG